MTGADVSHILQPGHVLTDGDVLRLSALLEPGWKVRARRREARDRLLARVLADHWPGPPTVRAKHLARAWQRYVATVWPRERERPAPTGADALRAALHRLTELSGGDSLSWRAIYGVAGNSYGGCNGPPAECSHGTRTFPPHPVRAA